MESNQDEESSLSITVSSTESSKSYVTIAILAHKSHKHDHFGSKTVTTMAAELGTTRKKHIGVYPVYGNDTFDSILQSLITRLRIPSYIQYSTYICCADYHLLVYNKMRTKLSKI